QGRDRGDVGNWLRTARDPRAGRAVEGPRELPHGAQRRLHPLRRAACMTRIVIADDQALFREGLRTLLSTRSDMDVVGEASDGDEAVALVEKLQPAVVLMDLRMPRADGIQATARIRERWPEIPVLVLTTFDDDANLFGALRAGAAGYLLKDVSSETLISAIQAATRGESFLQSTVTGRVVAA